MTNPAPRPAGAPRRPFRRLAPVFAVALVAVFSVLLIAACGDDDDGTTPAPTQTGDTAPDGGDISGSIEIDGSSTVYPITEAMAEEFMAVNSGVRITVGISGTGGGFERFCAGETLISDASRPIKQEEIDACASNGIDFIELPIAFDALSVLVNPATDFVDCITVEELQTIWEPAAQGTITNWNQVNPNWPDQSLSLYGPGTDSGTFDYFTDAINGEEGASRGDYVASEDDNVLVQGIAGEANALGYFGFAYYVQNTDKLKALAVDGGAGCVAPSPATVEDGTYQPLSRPIFIYVRADAAARPEVAAFAHFYLDNADVLVPEVGYVALPAAVYDLDRDRFDSGTTGSVFSGGSQPGLTLEDILSAGQ